MPNNNLTQYETKVFSQNGEDGIVKYIFSRIGVVRREFVEFGVGDGRECNTANLSLKSVWSGLLLEANYQLATAARSFYQQQLQHSANRVRVEACHVTAENINNILFEHGCVGSIDLLSIDVDGNDYWIWQAVEVIRPRVVVIEYNGSFGPEMSITIPYEPAFAYSPAYPHLFYHGASLTASLVLGP